MAAGSLEEKTTEMRSLDGQNAGIRAEPQNADIYGTDVMAKFQPYVVLRIPLGVAFFSKKSPACKGEVLNWSFIVSK